METRTTDWFVPSELPKSDGSDGPSVLHLDEINNGSLQMLAVMMQLVCERRVGDYIVPDNCYIIASGNRRKDSRAVVEMPRPLKKRFLHYTMIADVAALLVHAKTAGFPVQLQAFFRFRPECIMHETDNENASATSSHLEMCGAYINEAPALRLKAFTAAVGKTVGTELESFCEMFQNIPDMRDVLANPTTALVPTEPSQRYAVASALGRLADRSNFANAITYAKRLNREIEVMAVLDATDARAQVEKHEGLFDVGG